MAEPNKLAVALAAREAMRNHRKGKAVAFQSWRFPPWRFPVRAAGEEDT